MWETTQKKLMLQLLAMAKELTKSSKYVCGLVTVTGIIHDFQLNCIFCTEVFVDFIEFNEHIITKHRRNPTLNDVDYNDEFKPDNSTEIHKSLVKKSDRVYSYGTTFIDFVKKQRETAAQASKIESEEDESVIGEQDFALELDNEEKIVTKDEEDELLTEFEEEGEQLVSNDDDDDDNDDDNVFVKVEEYFQSEFGEESGNRSAHDTTACQNDGQNSSKLQNNNENCFENETNSDELLKSENQKAQKSKWSDNKISSNCITISENESDENVDVGVDIYNDDRSDLMGFSSDFDSDSENSEHSVKGKYRYSKFSLEEVAFLIDTYKQYPVLWDCQKSIHTSSLTKSKMYAEIAKIMQDKFERKIDIKHVQNRVRCIRIQLKQELRSMVKEKREKPNLWYFDKISFVLKHERYGENEKIFKQFEEDMHLNSDFVDLYKSCKCLWDRQNPHYKNEEKEKEAHNFLIKSMKDKWNIDLSEKLVLHKIAIMYCLHKESKSNDCVKTYEKPWYYEKLNFLGERRRLETRNKHECEVCHNKFSTDVRLKNHLYRIHEIKSFVCEICRKVFHNTASLKRHSYTHLTLEERPYACKTCGHKFADKVNCTIHERRHKKQYSHSCEICNRQFYTRNEVHIHMRIHTGEKPYVCDECGKSYRGLSEITQHRLGHLGQRSYKCKICSKGFYNQKSLHKHTQTHSTARNKVCDICGRGFKSINTLRQHKELHAKEKKYTCKICGRAFAQQAGLHGHMKTHGVLKVAKLEGRQFDTDEISSSSFK